MWCGESAPYTAITEDYDCVRPLYLVFFSPIRVLLTCTIHLILPFDLPVYTRMIRQVKESSG